MKRHARVRVIARQGGVEELRYRKRDDGQHYQHTTEAPTDLFLVDVDGKKGSLVLPRGRADGWEKDGDTYWLTNKPTGREQRMATKRRRASRKARATKATRRRGTARRTSKRTPPLGFKTWSAYMASIRPNTGGTVAAKKSRRRKGAARRSTRRRRSITLHANPRRHATRRRYRRNPPFGGGIIGKAVSLGMEGVKGAVVVVGAEAVTRLIRSRVLNMPAGQTLSSAAEFGIAIAGGVALEKVAGRQVARDFVVGGTAGVLRATAKQLGVPFVSEALSDDGPRILPRRSARALPRMNGYVRPLGSYASPESELYGS